MFMPPGRSGSGLRYSSNYRAVSFKDRCITVMLTRHSVFREFCYISAQSVTVLLEDGDSCLLACDTVSKCQE